MEHQSKNIEFIEGASYRALPAPLGKRLLAIAIDLGFVSILQSLVVFFGIILLGFIVGISVAMMGGKKLDMEFISSYVESLSGISLLVGILVFLLFILLVYLVLFGCVHGYFIYYEYKKQATYGKKMFALRVISVDGSPLTLRQCTIREFMRWIEGSLVIPALVSMLVTEKNQRLGDLMAGTMVTHLPSEEKEVECLYLSADEFRLCCQRWPAPNVSKEEAESFLRLAYPVFIYPGKKPSDEVLKYEADKLMRHYPEMTIDDHELFLRFHAQHCLKVANQ